MKVFVSLTFHAVNASGPSIVRKLESFICSVARLSKMDTRIVRSIAGRPTQARPVRGDACCLMLTLKSVFMFCEAAFIRFG
ncbi:hypothetical protein ASZ97_13220 [Brucella melitensis]|nr:hypothetical protein BMNI_I0274 [Brucella melitensis NI]AIN89786.1 hypothetical protein DM30_01305 [Brucella abortus]AOG43055.1 hypothetical protein BFS01_01315 [Brucella sp. 2002734562]AOG49131.1 hypothetical protein BFL33_01280 [Brucella melitensis]EEP63780.1 Hypothetical protein BAAA_1000279 [Brucella abortus str. 2308 A]ERM03800.1 hypothetical protein P408_15950 [Brucella abortus S99]KFH23003.1 hypothetical protein IB63_06360 [Brucella abortus 544]KFJ50898.1 hypothetical protein DK47_